MQTYLAEALGTMILVLLGDGVVANVLLDPHQGAELRLDRHHHRMGHRRGDGGLCRRPDQRRASEPCRHHRAGDDRQFPVGAGARLHRRADGRRDRSARCSSGSPTCRTGARPPIAAAKLGVFCTGPAIRHAGANLITEIIGTAVLLFGILAIAATRRRWRKPGDVDLSVVFSRGLQPLLVGVLVLGIGLSLGGPTGYAINPGARSRPAPRARDPADSRQGLSDWVQLDPVVAPIVGGIAGAGLYCWSASEAAVLRRGAVSHASRTGRAAPSSWRLELRSEPVDEHGSIRRRTRPGNDQHPVHDLRPRRQRDRAAPARAPADPAAARDGSSTIRSRSPRAATRRSRARMRNAEHRRRAISPRSASPTSARRRSSGTRRPASPGTTPSSGRTRAPIASSTR